MNSKTRLRSRIGHHESRAVYYALAAASAVRAAAWHARQGDLAEETRQLARAARWRELAAQHRQTATRLWERLMSSKIVLTTVAPADPDTFTLGKVYECFTLPFDIKEIVLCEGELSFITTDGKQVHLLEMDLEDPICPRCDANNDLQQEHHCENPLSSEMVP